MDLQQRPLAVVAGASSGLGFELAKMAQPATAGERKER